MSIIKCRITLGFLLLLGVSFQSWSNAEGQTPKPDQPLTGAEAILAQAINLYAKHTTESTEAAVEMCEKARKSFNETGDAKNEGRTLFLMGLMNNELNNRRSALKNFLAALPLIEKVKDKAMEAKTRSSIGAAYARLGERQKAVEAYNLALLIVRETNNKAGEAGIVFSLGTLCEELGDKEKALGYFKQALLLYKTLGDKEGEAETVRSISRLQ
jgi:tetratricopeptide (TPR) repeat protein